MASSSSTAPSSSILENYDVFISFRGDDTRRNFTSQLHHALCQKNIKTFIDSYDLVRGENISQALLQAIEESTVWVIIFSENYASSRWCLDELVEIVKCMNMNKNTRIAIPVFYNVDPSHVRHQSGSYEKYKDNSIDKAEEWKVALTTTANLSGWDSKSSSNDVELIKAIVEDVSKRLSNLHPSDSKLSGLVGIDEQIAVIELLMGRESTDICMIGIWGMGGIGKTTIAGALYNKLSGEYNGSCFVQNVREEMEKHGAKSIRNQIFSKLLGGENVDIDTPLVDSSWVITRLQRIKVLIVLDDVNDSSQLDDLVKNHNWFGKGSRIIVTTRDKQVIDKRAYRIYEVKELKFDEAHQLFCAHAFQRNELPVDYMELCHKAIEYAKGVPLALKVLGSLLFGTSMDEWKSALDKLKEIPNEDIQKVLRLSYDSLDQKEKDIFLDIVHFFKRERKDYVKSILDGCGFYADIGIKRLLDKSLIIIGPNNRINMHDLIEEMGLNVVCEKYLKEPQSRSRLNDHEEICHVLNNNKGTEAIEGIWLDYNIQKAVRLRPDVFANMQKLRILLFDICNVDNEIGVYCSKALKLPDALRLLHWREYPLKSLPSSFCPKELVSLSLKDSKIKKLWNGVQELPNLQILKLDGCVNLIKLPNLSRAPSLKTMNLSGCSRLVSVPSSIEHLQNLVYLSLSGCQRLGSIPPDIHLSSLSELDLTVCGELEEFSVTSDTMKSLTLRGTAIKKIHPSICRLHTLVKLDLRGCSYIFEIPDDLLRSLVSLEDLILECTNIQSIPASIKNLSRLRGLFISACKRLESLPQLPSSINRLIASRCTKLEIVPSPTLRMISQDWNQYNKREPYDYSMISQDWNEYINNFDPVDYSYLGESLSFLGCKKLDQKALEIIEAEAKLSIHRVAYLSSRKRLEGEISSDFGNPEAQICLPGNEIPEWFSYRTTGSSITIGLLPALLYNHNFLGFALCHVNTGCLVATFCRCNVYFYFGEELVHSELFDTSYYEKQSNDHVVMIYKSDINFKLVAKLKELFRTRYSTIPHVKITFTFGPSHVIKKTGVKLVWLQDQECLLQGIGIKRHRAESGHEESEIWMFPEEEEPQKRMTRIEDNECIPSNWLRLDI